MRYFVNEVDPPDQGLIDALARAYYTRNYEIEPMVRMLLLSPQFKNPVELLQALLLASRVRRAIAEGSRLERLLGEQRAQPAHQHGAAAVRAA